MDKETEKKYWQAARRRLQMIDWDLPAFEKEVAEEYAKLPKREENEDEWNWLMRVLPQRAENDSSKNPSGLKDLTGLSSAPRGKTAKITQFTPFTRLKRRAASGKEDYPLPDVDYLYSEDESLRFSIKGENEQIIIEVEALGHNIAKLADKTLGIAYQAEPKKIILRIALDDEGEGKLIVEDALAVRRALFNPLIGIAESDDD